MYSVGTVSSLSRSTIPTLDLNLAKSSFLAKSDALIPVALIMISFLSIHLLNRLP